VAEAEVEAEALVEADALAAEAEADALVADALADPEALADELPEDEQPAKMPRASTAAATKAATFKYFLICNSFPLLLPLLQRASKMIVGCVWLSTAYSAFHGMPVLGVLRSIREFGGRGVQPLNEGSVNAPSASSLRVWYYGGRRIRGQCFGLNGPS